MMQGRRICALVQGDVRVSDEPDVVMTTTLGSCVAACLFDVRRGLGGMNHFLLPDRPGSADGPGAAAQRYGVHLMELLINGLLTRGASRAHLQAKVFGGACITDGLTDAGGRNAAFVEHFLRHEEIPLVARSLGGRRGRRVQFCPASGRARQILCDPVEAAPPRAPAGAVQWGELEMFQ